MRRGVIVAACALAAAGCGGGSSTQLQKPSGVQSATAQDILHHSGRWAGATVVVAGAMGSRLQAHAFTIDAGVRQTTRISNRGLLVIAKSVPAATTGKIVLITGTVVLFRPSDAKQQIPVSVDVAKLEVFNRKPAILATKVAVRK
jgi:hypothetical protein